MKLLKVLLRKLNILHYIRKHFAKQFYVMKFPTFDSNTHKMIISKSDYFRYATIGLAVQRILSEEIEGNLAEVGVYRGDMSQFIHQLAPDRTFILFDTFEGFPSRDLESDVTQDSRFKDSSVEIVTKKLGNLNNIIIKKGYVPDTFSGLGNETFSFVLLDLDLYKPTASSLQFFYPRITKGGYLIVHDYNSPESNWACKRAVDEFMADKPEQIVEIADSWGTVLLRKS